MIQPPDPLVFQRDAPDRSMFPFIRLPYGPVMVRSEVNEGPRATAVVLHVA